MSSEITIQQLMDRFMQGAGDALTDDTVARLGFMMNELLIIADRVTRYKNIMILLELSESKDFAKMLDALSVAYDSYKDAPRTTGGIGGMLKVMGDPDVQGALKLLGNFGKELNK